MTYFAMAYDEADEKNGYWVHDTGLNVSFSQGKLTLKESDIDDLVVTVNQNNQLFDNVRPMHTHIEVFDDHKLIFRGRAIKPENQMETSGQFLRTYTFESIESYLLDSTQRFLEVHDTTPADFFKQLIDVHNSQVDDYQKFTVRNVDVTNSTDNVYRFVDYKNTRDVIKEKLLSRLGGFLRVEYKDGKNYIDYLKDPGTDHKNDTPIQLGTNLKSASETIDPTKVITRLIPLGAEVDTDKGHDSDGDSSDGLVGPTEPVNGDWTPVIKYAAQLTGTKLTQGDIDKLLTVIKHESGGSETVVNNWDINAQQGHPSKGLFQFIYSTFMHYAVPPLTDWLKGLDQTVAVLNDSNWRNDLTLNGWGPTGSRRMNKLVVQPGKSGGSWGWPFPGGYKGYEEGQQFGVTSFSRGGNNFHDGFDFGSGRYPGKEVHAIHGGTVVKIAYAGGLLYYVVTHSSDGYYIDYQEAFSGYSSIKVKVGDRIKTGDVIGIRDYGGSNMHLHVSVTKKNFDVALGSAFRNDGTFLDPIKLIKDGKESKDFGTGYVEQDPKDKVVVTGKNTIDIDAGYEMFKKAQSAHLQYQMNSLRYHIMSDQKYSDCSAFVSYFLELALNIKDRTMYSTETLHDFLKRNNYELVYEGNSTKLPTMQAGDVIIWGKLGTSSGANGHTAVMRSPREALECSTGWPGGYPGGSDVYSRTDSTNPTLDSWYAYDVSHHNDTYIYRYKGTASSSGGSSSSKDTGPRPRINIASVNNGNDFIDIPDLQKEFGIINGVQTWDDVHDPAKLKAKAEKWIAKQKAATSSWTVSALELPNFSRFEVSDRYMFDAPNVSTKQLLRITQKEIDFVSPYSSALTIGDKQLKLANYQVETKRAVQSIPWIIERLSDLDNQVTDFQSTSTASDNDDDNTESKPEEKVDVPQLAKDFEGVKKQVDNLKPEQVTADLSKAKLLFQYDHYKDHLGSHDYAMQFVKSTDENIYSSHHYQDKDKYPDGTIDAVEIVRRDNAGKYLDDMVVWNSPHGSNFGLINENNQMYIVMPVFEMQGSNRITYLSKVPYFANTELKSDDKRIIRMITRKRSISAVYDNESDYYASKNSTGGQVDVMEGEDVTNGEFTDAYTFNLKDFGIDINKQTVQSMDLKLPYLFVNSGNIDMHDKRMMYCINVVTKKKIFAQEIKFNSGIKAIGNYQEPEAISIHKENDGSFSLWLSFNMGSKEDGHTEVVYIVPLELPQKEG